MQVKFYFCFNSQPYTTASNQPVPIGDNTVSIHSTRWGLARDEGMRLVLYSGIAFGEMWAASFKNDVLIGGKKTLSSPSLQVYETTTSQPCDFDNHR